MNSAVKTPWHLWVIGVLSLLWNAFPVVDFTLTNMQNATWLAPMTEPQRSFILDSPAWVTACWGLGGIGSFVGSILLLMRSRLALAAYIASALGLAGVIYYQLVQNGDRVAALFGNGPLYTYITIAVVLIALFLYARAMAAKGVLR